jgi:hypothetical protein
MGVDPFFPTFMVMFVSIWLSKAIVDALSPYTLTPTPSPVSREPGIYIETIEDVLVLIGFILYFVGVGLFTVSLYKALDRANTANPAGFTARRILFMSIGFGVMLVAWKLTQSVSASFDRARALRENKKL